MSNLSSRVLSLLALVVLIVGCVLVGISAIGSTRVTNSLGGHSTSGVNVPLFIVGMVLIVLPVIFIAIYWAMKLSRVQR